ncbi:LysR family transcriptional regulator [Serratia bockelmannii]|uniref:LysR family transcriptional regulator n=1 Tax=Serratia TaxID=613 RepID=UPI0013DD4A77|nr:LysR family transcriptional regulator [Serratia marcescens]
MDLNAIKIFVSIAHTGSLSGASERLQIPLPTVSRHIRELESQLKVQLLERSSRGSKLTEAGTRLYEYASRGIEILDEAQRALVSDQAQLKGRLRLSLPTGFEPWWELLSDFRTAFPEIFLQVYATERRVDHLEDGIDVALRIGSVVHDSMIARCMLVYRHVLVASPAFIKQNGKPSTPEHLNHFPCGFWSSGVNYQNCWKLGVDEVTLNWAIVTNDYGQLRSCAMAGELITELPPFMAAKAIRDGKLISLMQEHPMPEQQVNLVYPSHRYPSAIVRAYLDFCQTKIEWLTETCSVS